MKTLWTPASRNFLDIALFASGSGSLMSKNDLQIFRNPPLSWIMILIRRESASSPPLFRKISLIKASRSLQSTAGCLKFFESFVFLSSMWYVNRRISKKSSSWWFFSLISFQCVTQLTSCCRWQLWYRVRDSWLLYYLAEDLEISQ